MFPGSPPAGALKRPYRIQHIPRPHRILSGLPGRPPDSRPMANSTTTHAQENQVKKKKRLSTDRTCEKGPGSRGPTSQQGTAAHQLMDWVRQGASNQGLSAAKGMSYLASASPMNSTSMLHVHFRPEYSVFISILPVCPWPRFRVILAGIEHRVENRAQRPTGRAWVLRNQATQSFDEVSGGYFRASSRWRLPPVPLGMHETTAMCRS